MQTVTRKNRVKHHQGQLARQLPRNISRQLENIYAQSYKQIKRHPYQLSSILLGIGVASSIFLLVRYLKNSNSSHRRFFS